MKRIIAESYPVLLVAMAVSLAGGVLLDSSTDLISRLPLLAMIPIINGTGGNLGSILGARLSSALHMGTLQPKLRGQSVLNENLSVAALQGVVVFSIITLVFSASQYFFLFHTREVWIQTTLSSP